MEVVDLNVVEARFQINRSVSILAVGGASIVGNDATVDRDTASVGRSTSERKRALGTIRDEELPAPPRCEAASELEVTATGSSGIIECQLRVRIAGHHRVRHRRVVLRDGQFAISGPVGPRASTERRDPASDADDTRDVESTGNFEVGEVAGIVEVDFRCRTKRHWIEREIGNRSKTLAFLGNDKLRLPSRLSRLDRVVDTEDTEALQFVDLEQLGERIAVKIQVSQKWQPRHGTRNVSPWVDRGEISNLVARKIQEIEIGGILESG